jgi:RNA polymerase sigma factor (sigma-70 family)
MQSSKNGGASAAHGQTLFVTTRWSVVLKVQNKESPESKDALETLCQVYWYPVYALVRGSGYAPHDAQDLTQAFYARLLAKDYLRVVTPDKGRFRTFLRMALKRFLAQEWQRLHAQKRGGHAPHLSFDAELAEHRFLRETTVTLTPDRIYDRRWALTLLDQAMTRLEREYIEAGKTTLLRQLQPHLTTKQGSIPYPEIAAALQTTEGAARVAVHRLRKRFRELFREAIADTVSGPEQVEPELRHVLEILREG